MDTAQVEIKVFRVEDRVRMLKEVVALESEALN
jgi:hypothetical protein